MGNQLGSSIYSVKLIIIYCSKRNLAFNIITLTAALLTRETKKPKKQQVLSFRKDYRRKYTNVWKTKYLVIWCR